MQALLTVFIPRKLTPSLLADFLISNIIALGKIRLKYETNENPPLILFL